MANNRTELILRALRKTFTIPSWTTTSADPFRTLIATIISQHTNEKNTARAFQRLSNNFQITPEKLAKAKTRQLEECLKDGGLYHNKAKAIKQTSGVILQKYNGNLDRILSMPLEDARKRLMQLPGVGPKTADVVLLFSAKKPTLPVDTHVNRVSKRLGIVPEDADFEAVRSTLQSLYNPRDYFAVHTLLIAHGRNYCKAKVPLCNRCTLSSLCPSRHTCYTNRKAL